jgi:hypothetical protein
MNSFSLLLGKLENYSPLSFMYSPDSTFFSTTTFLDKFETTSSSTLINGKKLEKKNTKKNLN